MSRRTASILRRAAELVEQRGWCQDKGEDFLGHICAVRAVSLATTELDEGEMTGLCLDATFAVEEHLGVGLLYEWNDARDRIQADVVKAFHQVADLEDFR